MPGARSIEQRTKVTACRVLLIGCLAGLLLSCSSSSSTTSHAVAYRSTPYDTYYRSGINRHHYNNYRYRRPAARPARRR